MSGHFQSQAPGNDEYAPYYQKYVARVPAGNIIETLSRQKSDTMAVLSGLTDEQAMYSYAPGKWNIKQVLGHITDAERVFAYRTLRFARNDQTALPGFEEKGYAEHGGHSRRSLSDLLGEFAHVRIATLDLLGNLDETAWLRVGNASGFDVSVRGLAWIIAGHELHHREVILTRYLQTKQV